MNSANYRGNIGKERKKFKFIFFYFSSGEDIQRMMALEKHTVYGLNLQGGMRNRVKVQTVKFQTVRTGYRVNSWDEICGKTAKLFCDFDFNCSVPAISSRPMSSTC